MEKKYQLTVTNQNNLILKVSNSIAITNKLITENNKQLVREIFQRNPKLFIDLISHFHELNFDFSDYASYLNWSFLSSNINLKWSEELIDIYYHKWNWGPNGLSQNSSLPWSEEFIDRYIEKILIWDYDVWCKTIDKNSSWINKLDWKYKKRLSSNANPKNKLINESGFFRTSETKNKKIIKWMILSSDENLPWSIEFIDKHVNKWDWHELSCNRSLPWSEQLIDKYIDNWNWYELTKNKNCFTSEKIIDKYVDYLKLGKLGCNINLKLTRDIIQEYFHYWNWPDLSWEGNFVSFEECIEVFKDRLDWQGLSWNENVIWTMDLIEKYNDKWDWVGLSSNRQLPWSHELFKKYENNWIYYFIDGYAVTMDKEERSKFGLFFNESIPWIQSIKYLHKYCDEIHATEKIWNILKPYIDDEMVIELLEEIKNKENG